MTALRFTTWQSPYKPGHRQMMDLSGAAYRSRSGRMPDGTRLSQQAAEPLRVSALRASILSAGDTK